MVKAHKLSCLRSVLVTHVLGFMWPLWKYAVPTLYDKSLIISQQHLHFRSFSITWKKTGCLYWCYPQPLTMETLWKCFFFICLSSIYMCEQVEEHWALRATVPPLASGSKMSRNSPALWENSSHHVTANVYSAISPKLPSYLYLILWKHGITTKKA